MPTYVRSSRIQRNDLVVLDPEPGIYGIGWDWVTPFAQVPDALRKTGGDVGGVGRSCVRDALHP
ncbi:hypothetical protein GCM10027290_25880 [Micromonospora sonneratiae]